MVTRHDLDKMLLTTIGFVLVLSVGIYLYSTDYFSLRFAAEDGLVEYATAIFLFLASIVLVKRALGLTGRQQRLLVVLTLFYALLFFFAAQVGLKINVNVTNRSSSVFFIQSSL